MRRYFAYSDDFGFECFDTIKEAREAAENYIDEYRSGAGDGWDGAVENVCYGEVKSRAESVGDDERGYDYILPSDN